MSIFMRARGYYNNSACAFRAHTIRARPYSYQPFRKYKFILRAIVAPQYRRCFCFVHIIYYCARRAHERIKPEYAADNSGNVKRIAAPCHYGTGRSARQKTKHAYAVADGFFLPGQFVSA